MYTMSKKGTPEVFAAMFANAEPEFIADLVDVTIVDITIVIRNYLRDNYTIGTEYEDADDNVAATTACETAVIKRLTKVVIDRLSSKL